MGNNYSRKVQTVQQQLGLEPLPEHYLLQPGTSVYRNSQQTQSPHANCLQTCSLTHYLVLLNKEHLPAYKRSYQFRQSHPDRLIQIVHGSIRVCGDDYCKLDLYL